MVPQNMMLCSGLRLDQKYEEYKNSHYRVSLLAYRFCFAINTQKTFLYVFHFIITESNNTSNNKAILLMPVLLQ